MALSSEDKQKIVFVLGYAGKILIPTSTHFNRIFSDRMENLNTFIEDQVGELLELIDAARLKITATTSNGNVKKIDGIELDTTRTKSLATGDYKRLLHELSCLLDIPIVCINTGNNFNIVGP